MAGTPTTNISSSRPSQANLLQSSHRMPTVSASQALQDLGNHGPSTVSSGLHSLDINLTNRLASTQGGFERGKTTEIWGPSGAGKTALMLQTTVGALRREEAVTWIDAATPLSGSRLQVLLEGQDGSLSGKTAAGEGSREQLARFYYRAVPSLSHLLALILHPQPGFPPAGTSLLVINGLNSLIDIDYPRVLFANAVKTEQQKWQASRRYAILGSLIAGLNKLAVLNNLAVIVSTGCASRMRHDSGLGSALVPGIGGAEWDGGVWNRLVLFRDFCGRFIGLQKCQGRSLISRDEIGETGKLISFDVGEGGGVKDRSQQDGTAVVQQKVARSPTKPRKRAFDEVADSEDEDVDEYGWADGDENALAGGTVGEEQAEISGNEDG